MNSAIIILGVFSSPYLFVLGIRVLCSIHGKEKRKFLVDYLKEKKLYSSKPKKEKKTKKKKKEELLPEEEDSDKGLTNSGSYEDEEDE